VFGDSLFNLTSIFLFVEKFHTNANNNNRKKTNKLWHISTLGPVIEKKIANFQKKKKNQFFIF